MKHPIAYFKSAQDNRPRQGGLTWPELLAKLTAPHKIIPVPGLADLSPDSKAWKDALDKAKKAHPLFSPVLYKEGATRGNAGVVSVSCFVADLDELTPSELAEIRKSWEGLAWCLYSSVKHRAEAPRLRVVFPLAAPVPASEWPRVWLKLTYHLTENRNDPATKDAARMHFLPIVPAELSEDATSDVGEGSLLDPALFADPPAFERVADLVNRGPVIGASSTTGSGKPGHDFNEKATHAELLALLQKHGWQEHSRKGNAIYVTRPGKDTHAGVSGVVGWPGDPSPVFYCFTSSFPALEARAYAPFGLLGTLEYAGRFDDAAKELGKAGYGEPLPQMVELDISGLGKAKSLPEREQQAKQEARPLRLSEFNQTDAGNSERLILRHGNDIRFVLGLGWRVWDGKRWAADDTAVTAYARETIRALYLEAAELLREAHQEPDKDIRKQLAASAEGLSRFAIRSESTRALAAMVEQTKSFAEIKVPASIFDDKPWQVPFQNGVWDRGAFREHRRGDYIEHLLPVCYDKEADRSEFTALLDRVTGGDAEFAKSLQDTSAAILSGASSFRTLPWAYGKRGTGKSTWAELMLTMLGPFGHTLDWSLLSGQREDEKLGAAVRGKRLLVIPEAGKKRLDAEILKSLSGGDSRTCRYLYEKHSTTIKPSWVLVAVSNDPPNLFAHDDALKERIMALPFTNSLEEGEEIVLRDGKRIEEVRKIASSALLAGFTAWVIEGLHRLLETQEIYRARVVIEHTRKFWNETDPLTPFWEGLEKAEIERGMAASALHAAYLAWCEKEGIKRPIPQGRGFAAACRAAGLDTKKTPAGMIWFMPSPTLPLQSDSDNAGMQDQPSFSATSPKKEDIGKVTENNPYSCIPALNDQRERGTL